MQHDATPPALARLSAAVAAELDAGGTPQLLCERLAAVLREALRDDALTAVFEGHERSFEAYRDPQRGFVVHASIHGGGHKTGAHDHAEAWAVYGVYRGATAHRVYDRAADRAAGTASLTLREECIARPGEVTVILPGQVHENWNPEALPAWNVVLRPRSLREVWRRAYDLESGAYRPMRAQPPVT